MSPKKCQIWTRWFAGCMFIVEKTPRQRMKKIWIPLQSWGFPFRKHGTSSVMVRFMKGVHDNISQTFSNFYQGMVRSYHGTMPGVMFFKHLLHFSIVENPTNKHLWLTIATHFNEISIHYSLWKAWESIIYLKQEANKPLCSSTQIKLSWPLILDIKGWDLKM